MDEVQIYMKKRKPVVLISGSIFSSAIFIGSVFLFQSNEYLGSILDNPLIKAKKTLFGEDYSIEIFFDFFVTGITNTRTPFSYFADPIFSSPSLISIGKSNFFIYFIGSLI